MRQPCIFKQSMRHSCLKKGGMGEGILNRPSWLYVDIPPLYCDWSKAASEGSGPLQASDSSLFSMTPYKAAVQNTTTNLILSLINTLSDMRAGLCTPHYGLHGLSYNALATPAYYIYVQKSDEKFSAAGSENKNMMPFPGPISRLYFFYI